MVAILQLQLCAGNIPIGVSAELAAKQLRGANDNIQVVPGDVLPGIPAHRLKGGADYHVTAKWIVGGDAVYESGQYFRGDESTRWDSSQASPWSIFILATN